MVRVPVVRVETTMHNSSRYTEMKRWISKLQVGQVMMIRSDDPELLVEAGVHLQRLAGERGTTFRILGEEERVYWREREGSIGLWRESEGYWLYVVKHAQAHGVSVPWDRAIELAKNAFNAPTLKEIIGV